MEVEGVGSMFKRNRVPDPGRSGPRETPAWAQPPAAGHWSQEGARTPERHHPVTRGSQTATSASSFPQHLGGTQLQGDRVRILEPLPGHRGASLKNPILGPTCPVHIVTQLGLHALQLWQFPLQLPSSVAGRCIFMARGTDIEVKDGGHLFRCPLLER